MLEYVTNFCNYWWFRYLMVTELYMVEKWERVTIHVLFAALFCLFWYFNYSVLLTFTARWLGLLPFSVSSSVLRNIEEELQASRVV